MIMAAMMSRPVVSSGAMALRLLREGFPTDQPTIFRHQAFHELRGVTRMVELLHAGGFRHADIGHVEKSPFDLYGQVFPPRGQHEPGEFLCVSRIGAHSHSLTRWASSRPSTV